MSRKKLSSFKQTDGKIRKEEQEGFDPEKHEVNSLDQLWGDSGFTKYKTMDLDEYKTQLAEMNTAELQRHAVEVAHVVPAPSRERLEKRLVLEFNKHVANYTIPKIKRAPEPKPSKEALRIMAEVK